MAVSKIRRVYLLVDRPGVDPLLKRLQDAGLVHLEPLDPEETADFLEPFETESRAIESRLSRIESAMEYLRGFEESPGMLASLSSGKVALSDGDFRKLTEDETIDRLLDEIERIQQELSDLDVRETRIRSALHHLAPWMEFDVPLELLHSTPQVEILCGSLPVQSLDDVKAVLEEDGAACHLEKVSLADGKAFVVVVDLLDEPPDAAHLLREAGFQPTLFPEGTGTVAEEAARLQSDLEAITARRAELRAEAARLAPEKIKLMAAWDRFRADLERSEALTAAAATRDCLVLGGWARTGDLPRLRSIVEKGLEGAALLDRDPLPDEEPPVVLENPRLVEPFQVVTNLYGLPRFHEIDPTVLLAPFFILSFGLAVGEGGYGVLLAVLSRLALKFLKMDEGGRRLFRLLYYCGIATFIAGTLMGSFFAVDFSSLPAFLAPVAAVQAKLKLFDPLQDSLLFLGIVLGIGFIQVAFGILISAVLHWREGRRAYAFFHECAWVLLMVMSVLWGIGWPPAKILWILAAVSIFLSAGIGARSIGARIGTGLYALYGITGIFGDILSFSRLFALGLATGVIAMVVNILAGMVRGVPWVGWLLMLVILVFGHLFNLAINALGAFIHTARLQFVEFFTKFFEGGGRRFSPFARHDRFTMIADAPPGGPRKPGASP